MNIFKFTNKNDNSITWIVAPSQYKATCMYSQHKEESGGLGDHTCIRKVTPDSMFSELADLAEGQTFVLSTVED